MNITTDRRKKVNSALERSVQQVHIMPVIMPFTFFQATLQKKLQLIKWCGVRGEERRGHGRGDGDGRVPSPPLVRSGQSKNFFKFRHTQNNRESISEIRPD
jgi:hypothetical protein